jgi:hypothetical protein
VAWNREHLADPVAGVNALAWSIIGMADATDRLTKVRAPDPPRAFAVVSEAVWWVTIVDSTLVRYHPEAYDFVLSGISGGARIEETLGGLRFVRNQIARGVDRVDFIEPAGGQSDRVADWRWSRQPEPADTLLSPQGRTWEISRYRAYQNRLAGHAVGQTFGDAAGFLKVAADRAGTTTEALSDQPQAARRGR